MQFRYEHIEREREGFKVQSRNEHIEWEEREGFKGQSKNEHIDREEREGFKVQSRNEHIEREREVSRYSSEMSTSKGKGRFQGAVQK